MSERIRITHNANVLGTNVEYRADILDSEYGGSVEEKLVSESFFEWEYDKINEKDPFENPVQKSSFAINLLIESDSDLTLLTDILDADENRFTIEFYIDSTLTWTGNVLTDLLEYPEADYPITSTIKAKDLSSLSGVDYDLVSLPTLTRMSVIIADCLKETGFSLPIRSYTNLTNSDIADQDEDFIYALFHQKHALRNKDTAISCLEVLENICKAYNLILKQSGGRWIIDQLPAVAKGDDVQFDYDSDGLNPTSSTPSRTQTIDGTDSHILPSDNIVTGALKSISSLYKHRVLVYNVPTEDVSHDSSLDSTTFRVGIEDDADNLFSISLDAEVVVSDPSGSMTGEAFFRVIGRRAGGTTLYLDQASGEFTAGEKEVAVDVSGSTASLTGSLEILETDSMLEIISVSVEFLWAEAVTQLGGGSTEPRTVSDVNFTNINAFVYNSENRDWEATLSHIYTRSGDYSIKEQISETLLGDGPTGGDNFASKGRPATSAINTAQVDPGNFKLRGVSESLSLEQITLRERVNMRRSALRNLRANMWVNYSVENLISYRSNTWFFSGGYFSAKRSRWNANIIQLSYDGDTTGDTFQEVAQSGGDPSGATSGTSAPSSEGVTIDEGDARWFQQSNNLSEGTASTIRDNIALGSTDDVTFGSATLSNLTSGRVAYAGASGLLQDSANLTFDGTNLALASATFGANNALTGTLGDARYGQLGAANTWTASNAFDAGLTATTATLTGKLTGVDADFTGLVNILAQSANENIFRLSHPTAPTEAGYEIGFSSFGGTDNAAISHYVEFSDTVSEFMQVVRETGDVHLKSNLFVAGDVEKDDFSLTTDFDGTGWQGTSAGDFNIRNLIVRESARFRELIIDQLSVIAGSDLLSVARGKIESIDAGANTVTIEDPNDRGATRFVANDFFWVKSVDIDNSTIVDLKGQVTSVSGTTLTLDTTVTGGTHAGGTTDISSLSVGDVIAQRGHPSNTDRQSLIYRTVSDSDAPVEKFFDGIDSLGAFDNTANIVVEIGPTSGHFGANNILTYSPDEVGLAGFTANSDYLTDGNTYIGNDLNANVATKAGKILIGNYNDGSANLVRAFGDTVNSFVQMIGRTSSSDAFFQLNSDGKTIMTVSGVGAFIDGDLLMTTGAAVANANEDARFQLRSEGFVVDYLSGGTWQRSMSVGSNGTAISGSLTAFPSSSAFDIFINLPTSDPVAPNQWFTKDFADLQSGDIVLCMSQGTESVPSAPSQPSVCKQSNALIVSWSAVSGADTYDIQVSQAGGAYTDLATDVTGTDVADTDPFGSPDDTFQYKVRACNSGGCSAYSTASTSTTFNTASSC